MIEIIDCIQGTEEWHQARIGIVTASGLSKVLAKGEGKTRAKYMYQLAGEIITGRPAESYSNEHMVRGKEEEEPARDLLRSYIGKPITPCGFIKNKTLRLGCSPDGIVGDGPLQVSQLPDAEGAEIKTCLAYIQAERLDKKPKEVPSEYRAQVEGSLLATGAAKWHFFSHAPGMPPQLVEVTLTDTRKKEIEAELLAFNTELDALVNKLKGMF